MLSILNKKKGFRGACRGLIDRVSPKASRQLYRHMEMGNRGVFTAVAFLLQGETRNIQ